MKSDTIARVFKIAAGIVGGPEALRARLGVTAAQLETWTLGTRTPPHAVFLQAVDILLEHNGF